MNARNDGKELYRGLKVYYEWPLVMTLLSSMLFFYGIYQVLHDTKIMARAESNMVALIFLIFGSGFLIFLSMAGLFVYSQSILLNDETIVVSRLWFIKYQENLREVIDVADDIGRMGAGLQITFRNGKRVRFFATAKNIDILRRELQVAVQYNKE